MPLTVIFVIGAAAVSPASSVAAQADIPWPVCGGRPYGPKAACVYDGDTFWYQGGKIRVRGYDAPEIGPPLCHQAAQGAAAARDRLAAILASGEITLIGRGHSFDRRVARVLVDGKDVAITMLAEGQGRPEVAGDPWC